MIDQEIIQTIEHLQNTFEDLAVRGLRSVGSQQLAALEALHEELVRIGATHMAGRIETIIACIKADDPGAARALMRAQASLRVFERLITVEAVSVPLRSLSDFEDDRVSAEEDE